MEKVKVSIAVDFDGTISNEREVGEALTLKEGAKEVLTKWYEEGHKLILWTCRNKEAFSEACMFLIENDMFHLFTAFNDHLRDVLEKYPDASRKVLADYYIDDRHLGVKIDWFAFDKMLEEELEGKNLERIK